MSVTQILLAALPWLTNVCGVTLPGILKNDRWKPWANGLVAGAAVLGMALLTLIAGGKITGNFNFDFCALVTTYSALLAKPLAPLDAYLQSAICIPLLHPPAQVTAIMQSVYPGGKPPQPIVLKQPSDQGG